MALPDFNSEGDLPAQVFQAEFAEVIARFGRGSPAREAATASLVRIHELAQRTGKLSRLVIFGSYVTAKRDPKDVDVILVMADDFLYEEQTGETRALFEHDKAAERFGASVFWVRPSAILVGTLDEFIAHWKIKRDRTERGIVEVKTYDRE